MSFETPTSSRVNSFETCTSQTLQSLYNTSRPLTLELLKRYQGKPIFLVDAEEFDSTVSKLHSESAGRLEQTMDLRVFYEEMFWPSMKFSVCDTDGHTYPLTFDEATATYGPGVHMHAYGKIYSYNMDTETYTRYDVPGYQIDQDGQLCNNALNGPNMIPSHANLQHMWRLVDTNLFD